MATIKEKANGCYQIRVFCGRDDCGRQIFKSKTFRPSKKNLPYQKLTKEINDFVKAFEDELREQTINNELGKRTDDPGKMPFAAFCKEFINVKKDSLSPNTLPFYCRVINRHLIPMFGKMRLEEFKVYHIQQFISYLCNMDREDGLVGKLSPQTVKRYATVLRSILSLAYKMEYIENDISLSRRLHFPLRNIKTIMGDTVDLTEIVNYMRSVTDNVSFEECIWKFVFAVDQIASQDLKNRHKENGVSFFDFSGTTILDSDGRIKCIVPAMHRASPVEMQHVWEHEAEQEYSLYADAFISRYLYIIKERFSFTEESLEFIVENNAFIPEERKSSFLKGIVAGFSCDYITALSILMPQVENALRCLARTCGAVVYKTEDNGVESCLSLDTILSLPEIVDCLDPTFLFNLKVFYTSSYGFGMRNIISHGLMSDLELFSCYALMV